MGHASGAGPVAGGSWGGLGLGWVGEMMAVPACSHKRGSAKFDRYLLTTVRSTGHERSYAYLVPIAAPKMRVL